MAHEAQQNFFKSVKTLFPEYFKNKTVLDVGSMDINGNNRYLFEDCEYTGLDIGHGRNVDIVCPVHVYTQIVDLTYNVVISGEMLEHDQYWKQSLNAMFKLVKPGGLLLISAAGTGRPEHGTINSEPSNSHFTHYYYKNITKKMILSALRLKIFLNPSFSFYRIVENDIDKDIYFVGIKNK